MRTICHTAYSVRFIPIAKNASTSIIAAMYRLSGNVSDIHKTKPPAHGWRPLSPLPTFAIIRDPADRLYSTWQSKIMCEDPEPTALQSSFKDKGLRAGMPFGDFLACIEQHGPRAFDNHILPQREYLPPFDADKVCLLPFELLDIAWYSAGLGELMGPLPFLNVSATGGIPPRLYERARALYRDDDDLHQAVTRGRRLPGFQQLAELIAARRDANRDVDPLPT